MNAPFTSITIPAIDGEGRLYPVEKMAAHREGLLHVAISIFLFRGDELLIQQRAVSKYHCGGQWANTVCSHPHWGEAPEAAAPRRLREELGASATLTPCGLFEYRADVGGGLVEHERVHMFRGEAEPDMRLAPDPEEVSDTRWVGVDDLRTMLEAEPERLTPWFRIYLARWPSLDFGRG